ncbi:MAG: MCP four helix bundle domain-containing protein, partial [Candidatus Contendobacter sp.]|nr:MCP four helix bundle domain-containing protein [Candidatus Contendobacter sp.]
MNIMNKMKVGAQLAIGFGAIAIIALALGLTGYYGAIQSDEAINEIGNVRLPSVQALLIISEAQTAVDSAENALLSTFLDAAERKAQHQRFVAAQQRVDQAWKVYEPLPQTVEEAVVWKQFVPAWNRWWKDHEDYVKLVREFETVGIDNLETNRTSKTYEQMNHQALVINGKSFSAAETLLNQLVEINQKAAASTVQSAGHNAQFMKVFNGVATAIGMTLAALLGWIITRGVTAPLRQGSEILGKIAEGDMTRQVPAELMDRKDEIGDLARAMKTMATQLREIVGNVTQST